MTLKKKLLAIAVSAAMLCCMMPSMAFAANIDDYDIFLTSYNTDGVQNNPKGNRFAFEITKSYNLKSITTYHWNNGNGKAPGTISLYEGGGNKIGSWQAVGRASSGRNNVNWDAFTNVTIKPGEYYIDDSSLETWSANSKSSWKPFVELRGNEVAGNNNQGTGANGSTSNIPKNSENLLQNPSFESGLSGWIDLDKVWAAAPNVVDSNYKAVHGKSLIWAEKSNAKDTYVYQDVSLKGHNSGEILELSTQTRNWDQSPADESKIVLKFLDASGKVLKEYSKKGRNIKWYRLTVSGPLPSGAVKARVELWAIHHSGVCVDAYYDDVSLKFSGGTSPVINNQNTLSSILQGKWQQKGQYKYIYDIKVNGNKMTSTYYMSDGKYRGEVTGTITGNRCDANWSRIENSEKISGKDVFIYENGKLKQSSYTSGGESHYDVELEPYTGSLPQTDKPAGNTKPTPDNAVPVTVTGGKGKATTLVFNGVTGVTVSFKTGGVIGYRLYRSESSGSLGVSVTDFYITSNNFTDVNVEPNTTYYYTLKEVLTEADPLNDKREQIGDVVATWTVKTADSVGKGFANSSKTRHFIMLKIDDPKMSVDGEAKEVDPGRGTVPMILRGRTMVPIRAIVEAMGGNVGWDAGSREVSLKVNSSDVRMWVDKKELTKNSAKSKIDVPPSIINNRTFVPLRFGTENLNCQVDWINSTKSIVIVWSE